MNRSNASSNQSYVGAIGLDGIFTFFLSGVVILLSGGMSYLWQLWSTIKSARDATTKAPSGMMLLVLGMRLRDGIRPTSDYVARLERACHLWREDPRRRVLVLGGLASGGVISEAACGRDYLLARGVSESHVLAEEVSRHTLENLRNAREIVGKQGGVSCVLITNRYHLLRSEVIARGLGMRPELCGAEDHLEFSVRYMLRFLLEAYYIHWYRVGAIWARLTSKKTLARIR